MAAIDCPVCTRWCVKLSGNLSGKCCRGARSLDLSIDTRFPIRETRLEHDWKKKSESRENRKTFTSNLKFRISKSNDDFVQIQRVKRISRLLYPKQEKESRGDKNRLISSSPLTKYIESYLAGSVLPGGKCLLGTIPVKGLDNGEGLLGWTAHQIAFKTVARAFQGSLDGSA